MDEGVVWPEWLNVSRETQERLVRLADLVAHWSPHINLVSRSSGKELWQRHIFDSAQVFLHRPDRCDHWVDIGSGGGFPGLVVAALALDLDHSFKVSLVESDRRKAVFLREAARQLQLPAEIISARIETLAPLGADVMSARALAPLVKLCAYSHQHLARDGVGLFLKGQNSHAEILEARTRWSFDLNAHISKTDPAAVVLELKELRHA